MTPPAQHQPGCLRQLPQVLLCLMLLLLPRPAPAQPLKLCAPNWEVWPVAYNGMRNGAAIELLRQAASSAGLAIEMSALPAKRCQQMVQQGGLAGLLVSDTPAAQQLFALPLAPDGRPDPQARVATLEVFAFRVRTTNFGWDGHHFTGSPRIGIIRSSLVLKEMLEAQHLDYDENSDTPSQLVLKLLAGRLDLILTLPALVDNTVIVASPGNKTVERLALPVMRVNVHLGFSPAYYQAHRQQADAVWQALAALNRQGTFKQLLESEKQHQANQ